jgi:adenosylcobinamide kinase / adenosylcobinamide-phosphate guanylyltransferase
LRRASLESGGEGRPDHFPVVPYLLFSLSLSKRRAGILGGAFTSSMVSLVIGGARSGKSRFALSLPADSERVAYIATARPEDAEMAARVARHLAERPARWLTVEEPLEIANAVERHAANCEFILLDCLTIWLSNFSWEHRQMAEESLQKAASQELERAIAAATGTHLVVVSNELGCGLVPESQLGRRFRDLHGWLNQDVARSADWVYHLVAGIAVPIKQPGAGR